MSEDRIAYASGREVLTPSQLTRRARDLLEDAFGLIWLEGEISNFARPASGHLYFSLKDGGAQVRCAMFKPKSALLRFRPADGMQVLARARVSLYEARGEFQLIVEHLEEAGEGALRREFERLKATLAAEGLFAAERKRALPRFPRRLAVVTSATGAAVRDVLSVLGRRYPLLAVDVVPVPVQGREAPPAIVAALRRIAAAARHDLILIARGGGSIEDLWAFNDEGVARAIHASPLPIVSAIGHETDFTIADFVADLRAPTPSAAAELIAPDTGELSRQLRQRVQRIELLLQRRLQQRQQTLDRLSAQLQARSPAQRLALGRSRLAALDLRLRHALLHGRQQRRERLAGLATRLWRQAPEQRLQRARLALAHQRELLQHRLRGGLDTRRARLTALARALHAVSPLAVLARGYALLQDAQDGRVIRAPSDTQTGTVLRARLAEGELRVRVE
ncbi:MAG TPA: exodeoxyribonuclease VII large subunit [Tahibacter sp.]|uniref:exodeoxyribonuclease VII large subunit n=1 Tax=Tahibacter sp. TaxID=2056211 RepID=UPI002BCD28CB|nr:exodeoxyribonuclease VII large subunit [Tahibacter sp.]HSX62724.1 exodeoxyribonuclease VII large subunit [Tahibacter sp.]